MPEPQRAHLAASTLDDLLHTVLEWIRTEGARITSTGGANTEIWGASLVLTNPLARLSRSETRGKVFSPLGELCWYLSGSDAHSAIEYYVVPYPNRLPDGRVFGAYGPRLRHKKGGDQLSRSSRRYAASPTRAGRSSKSSTVRTICTMTRPSSPRALAPCSSWCATAHCS